MILQFGDVLPFLSQNKDVGPSLQPKLLGILNNHNSLKIEMSMVNDVGEHFVKSTYNMEGDVLYAMKKS